MPPVRESFNPRMFVSRMYSDWKFENIDKLRLPRYPVDFDSKKTQQPGICIGIDSPCVQTSLFLWQG